ncbi:MAG TPA: hypothetical protein VJA26_12770, partial [Gammaproteobacteria bacterium]|nr:hypothetical protein [Gammaproteobacteria bacterium]
RLRAFIAGEITHFFVNSSEKAICTWDDDIAFQVDNDYGRRKIEAIKLVSVLGSSDGRLDYRLSRYSDGSGRDECDIVPCRSYDEALGEAQLVLNAEAATYLSGERGWFNPSAWQGIKGIQIPADALAKHEATKRAGAIKRITELRAEIDKIEAQL